MIAFLVVSLIAHGILAIAGFFSVLERREVDVSDAILLSCLIGLLAWNIILLLS